MELNNCVTSNVYATLEDSRKNNNKLSWIIAHILGIGIITTLIYIHKKNPEFW